MINYLLTVNPPVFVYEQPKNTSAIQSPTDLLMAIGVLAIIVVFLVVMVGGTRALTGGMEAMVGKNAPDAKKKLTPTQKFILAASSPTIGNNYKCVIDIWATHESEIARKRVKDLFEWGWGEFTYENALDMANHCLNEGHNMKYLAYCSIDGPSNNPDMEYTEFEIQLLEEMKQKYPKQGMLAWDLVRVLSIVGSAYMGGIMEYEEAVKIAFEACKRLQANFSSWDDMVGSYTLGYQFWRGERKTDRLKYYKKMKKTWVYNIAWDTELKEAELKEPQLEF